ncbi:LIC_20245 family lipoprotein [Leptospira sp. GIMC2001]|uniref:LIC_20245 family lipoprotein n=1 Tax=Leptospira sp. GIMC2001 TaxID=1513297 RepID=UPI00234B4FC0|nr:hypothetical protein [Leptospira sp. GIMC2001]WCL48567.1 hypothetical protein O4O04_14830 [Leptospira sp. GIMC2001]
MGIQKKLTYVGMFFAFIILIYFLFSTSDSDKKKKAIRSEDLSFLLGGSSSGGANSNPKGNPMGVRDADSKSVFDSDFYNSGGMTYEEEQANKDGKSGEIPINPQTGKPYPEEAMAQFDRLREAFPGNDLIPKRLTPDVKAQQEAKAEKLAQATRNVLANNAKAEDIEYYYSNMEKQSKDRLEIIEYLVDTQGGANEEMDKKFQDVMEGIKAQAAQITREKEEAYKRAGLL